MSKERSLPIAIFGIPLLAGIVMIIFVYTAAPLFGVETGDFSRFLSAAIGVVGGASRLTGLVILLIAAALWGLIFRQMGNLASDAPLLSGVLYGLGAWFVGAAVLLPLVSAINSEMMAATNIPSPGFMGMGFGGANSIALSMTAHAVFGGVLGLLSR